MCRGLRSEIALSARLLQITKTPKLFSHGVFRRLLRSFSIQSNRRSAGFFRVVKSTGIAPLQGGASSLTVSQMPWFRRNSPRELLRENVFGRSVIGKTVTKSLISQLMSSENMSTAENITLMVIRGVIALAIVGLGFYCVAQGIHFFALPRVEAEQIRIHFIGLDITASEMGAVFLR